ncbi:hypothetical protein, partial [Streptomyces microflavus]|uniref:hypothetical protein n=1 Tax=Streptomyces microflavus TaxID=1919 RepID=UPI0035E0F72C
MPQRGPSRRTASRTGPRRTASAFSSSAYRPDGTIQPRYQYAPEPRATRRDIDRDRDYARAARRT